MSTPVSPVYTAFWRGKNYLGLARPVSVVMVRKVLLNRAWAPFEMANGSEEDFGEIAGSKHNDEPWQAYLQSAGPWKTVPNVEQIELTQEMPNEGVAAPESATVQIGNINFQQVTGVAGIFHLMKRGYLAPWRGWQNLGRPPNKEGPNEWFDMLNSGIQVKIWQGYGVAVEPVFTGLVDDCDVRDNPDEIELTCRSFGITLTDQRVFGWAKAREISSPVVFADRLKADNVDKIGKTAKASSERPGYPAANVLKAGNETFWLSAGHNGPNFTEWIQIRVSKGRYETAYLNPRYPNMAVYMGVYCRSGGLGGKDPKNRCKVNDKLVPDGWVDRGKGNVPGANGGWPIARNWLSVNAGGQAKAFLFRLECGNETTIRFAFRNLGWSPKYGDFRASVSRLYGARRKLSTEAKKARWILVDDPSDVVKWVLMWAGFHEWEVEKFGVRIKEPMVFHQSDFLIDIIKHIASQGDFIFFIDRPTNDGQSVGVPTFRRLRAVHASTPNMLEVRDTDLLTGINVRFDKEPMAYILRTRGKEAPKKKGGVILGEDKVRRFMAVYYPPWSGAWHGVTEAAYDQTKNIPPAVGKLSGVYKHVIHTDRALESVDECQMANLFIAAGQALAAYTGDIEFPGHAGVTVDDQVSLVDTPSGMNTRMYITKRVTTFTSGEQTEYKTSVSGSMIDSPDLLIIAIDYISLLLKVLDQGGD